MENTTGFGLRIAPQKGIPKVNWLTVSMGGVKWTVPVRWQIRSEKTRRVAAWAEAVFFKLVNLAKTVNAAQGGFQASPRLFSSE